MEGHEIVDIEAFIQDVTGVLERVETEHVSISVIRGSHVVAVISPAPVAQKLAEIHRTLEEGARDDSFFLDVLGTRRLLGL
ncbi:MAG TPA: hypothetical protein VLA29_12285 [Acidimicrobiia bacterium]|nr:hypothetical protein [Acidimicrobiia bacterium]